MQICISPATCTTQTCYMQGSPTTMYEHAWYVQDVDIFFIRSATAMDFFATGPCTANSTVCNPQRTTSFVAFNDLHRPCKDCADTFEKQQWYAASAKQLGVALEDAPAFLSVRMRYTPQILSTNVIASLNATSKASFR